VISTVDPKSVGEAGGLRNGMLILSVGGVVVVNAKEAADLINKGNLNEGVRLRVLDPLGETRTVTLKQ
jgi:S1-C subfamily serine protease